MYYEMSIERDGVLDRDIQPFLFVHHEQSQGQSGKDRKRSEEIKQHLAQRQRKPRTRKKLEIHPSIGHILSNDPSKDVSDQDTEIGYDSVADQRLQTPSQFTGQLAPFRVTQRPSGSPTSPGSGRVSKGPRSQDISFDNSCIFNTIGECWHGGHESVQSVDVAYGHYNASLPSPFMLKAVSAGLFDSYSPSQESSDEIGRLLQLYSRHLRPLARSVSAHWDWVNDQSHVRASPMLTFAIAAYASAFLAGIEQGSRGVCLPPIPDPNQESLWPIPQWFRLQAKALTFLKQALAEEHSLGQPEIFHTMLFLFRLAVLLGDGSMGQIHVNALRQACVERGGSVGDLDRELAVVKANMVSIYQYKNAMVKVRSNAQAGGHPHYYIYPDRARWADEGEWRKFKAEMFCRNLTWHADVLGKNILDESRINVLQIDPGTAQLSTETFEDLVKAYQIALFLWSYLNNINFDPAATKVQIHVQELQQYLQHAGLQNLKLYAPRITFIILFVCAYASRGFAKRKWFISQVIHLNFHPVSMRDLYTELEHWCDPIQVRPMLLEEMLVEIRQMNEGDFAYDHDDLYQGEYYRPNLQGTPISKSPDLKTPLREL